MIPAPAGTPVQLRHTPKAGQSNRGLIMARFEIANLESGMLGEGPLSADAFYDLGIRYAVGNAVPADLVSAHKWFNIAAMKGSKEAAMQRQEIAAQMSPAEIATALRAARALLTAH
jgi:TPR repeat protein